MRQGKQPSAGMYPPAVHVPIECLGLMLQSSFLPLPCQTEWNTNMQASLQIMPQQCLQSSC